MEEGMTSEIQSSAFTQNYTNTTTHAQIN